MGIIARYIKPDLVVFMGMVWTSLCLVDPASYLPMLQRDLGANSWDRVVVETCEMSLSDGHPKRGLHQRSLVL